jgi:hypothetical protein
MTMLFTVALAAALAVPADVAPKLKAEIARVREASAKTVPSEQRGGLDARLKRADDAIAAGRIYLALLELQPAWEMECGFAFSNASGIKTNDEFLRTWKEIGPPPLPSEPANPARPLIAEAFADSSQARGPALYRASLPYSEDAGLPAGLYYLGESQAGAKFAAWVYALGWESSGKRPPMRSIEPELNAFERDVVQKYERADATQRPTYIGVNVALKLARELNTQGRYSAALLEYLRARTRFTAPVAEAPKDAAALKTRLAAAQQELRDGDHSVALVFLELAAASAENQDPTVSRSATAILDDVIPAYLAVVKR